MIVDIAKVYNPSIYSKFETECTRMIKKHLDPTSSTYGIAKDKLSYEKMFRFLFHGTQANDPELIYNSEDGLDIRFSRAGMMGQGIYFAEDPAYSF